jgi:hypothetical protein
MPQYQGTGNTITGDKAFASYLDTACWASYDVQELYAHDLTIEAIDQMFKDWSSFASLNANDIEGDECQAAHDFWLTRNGHGSGFWDGDWDDAVGERLTKSAVSFGQAILSLEDGKIYHY